MATPSSSATSPSPPVVYLPHTALLTPHINASALPDSHERDQRKKAVQKFLARAEVSMVTRALRARLSYASYKATHNIPNVPLRDLESQSQSNAQSSPFSRSIPPKRKPTGTSSYYHGPSTQGPNGLGASVRRGASGAMAPPTTTASPRTYHQPVINGHLNATTVTESGSSSRPTISSQSLYNSILAPPPTKQARTIHNPSDPPVPAPSRPIASPKSRGPKTAVRSIAESTRAHTKGRHRDQAPAGSAVRRKAKRPSTDKGKQKQKTDGMDVDVDGDVDMKAAATLTSLLLHHRPSIPGSVSSPRSSIDGSEAGSAYSYSQFAQSSARTATAPVSASGSTSTATDSSFRHQTPPPSSEPAGTTTTPRPAPTDDEAADLMLFLATSPSPARPSNKDSRDAAAYRALGGGSGVLRDKGRVLFPSATGDTPASGGLTPKQMLPLNRGGESSFTSTISSIGTDMGMRSSGDISSKPMPTPSQLLPPASLPLSSSLPGSPSRKDVNDSPRPGSMQGSVDFNFNDFIHVSPSPSRGAVGQAQKSNLGLRADVGRKLFEEEQIRQTMNGTRSPGKRPGKRSPSRGIDAVQS